MNETNNQDKRKKPIMLIAVAAVVILALAVGIGVYNAPSNRLARLLDLGQKYLLEEDYEQAVLAFREAIEIDPKCEQAYLGAADAYIGLGDFESAQEILAQASELMETNQIIEKIEYVASLRAEQLKVETVEKADEPKAKETAKPEAGAKETQTAESETSAETKSEETPAEPVSTEQAPAAETPAEPVSTEQAPVAETPAEPVSTEQAPVVETPAAETPTAPVNAPVNIRATGITADGVFINGGYGSLTINGADASYDDAGNIVAPHIPPQTALADRNGNLVFPYRSTHRNYYVSGDAISLTYSNPYRSYDPDWYAAGYYKLDGSEAFALKTEQSETVVDGVTERKKEEWNGGPMRDGYALAIKIVYTSWSDVGSGGVDQEYYSYIIDKNGTIVCTLPEEFNEQISFGGNDYQGGFSTRYSLGWCGEGLFAVFANEQNGWDFSTEYKGYMDAAGNMAIDLTGRGYTAIYPFHGGLAVVADASGMIGAIDKAGNQVIPCIYESLSSLSADGLFAAKKDGKWGYIGISNNVVIPFEYDAAYGAGDGLASVGRGGKFGFVDYGNQIAVPFEYDDVSSFENGVAYAIKDRALHIIEKTQ